jgi:hypothetical protein
VPEPEHDGQPIPSTQLAQRRSEAPLVLGSDRGIQRGQTECRTVVEEHRRRGTPGGAADFVDNPMPDRSSHVGEERTVVATVDMLELTGRPGQNVLHDVLRVRHAASPSRQQPSREA